MTGELLLHWYYLPNTPGFVVENVIPEIQICDEFLSGVDAGYYRGVTLKRDTTTDATPPMWRGDPDWHAWLLDINADNQHVIYRICEYLPGVNLWSARWPD